MTSNNPFSRHTGDEPTTSLLDLITNDPAPEPNESFWSNVESTLALAEDELGEDPTAVDIATRRRPTRWRQASLLTAAAALLVAGLAFTLNRQTNEPTTLETAAVTEETPSTTANTEPTNAQPEPTELSDEERIAIYDRLWSSFTTEEQTALENHGRAATAIYNIDGGLFFSLNDLAPYGDIAQEAETQRRTSCFLDGLRQVLPADDFAVPADMIVPVHPEALPAYAACVPADEILDRFKFSFLYGHREYLNNVPPIEDDDACFSVLGTPTEFVASLTDGRSGLQDAVRSCAEARSATTTEGTTARTTGVPAPELSLAAPVSDLTPVGYGHPVGLTADGAGLYTVSQAPGSDLTCLESRVSQFYLQPLDGGPRVAAGQHQIMGEMVTAFVSNDTHAVWIEFCEFSETMHVADIASDGSLVNTRLLTAATGDNRAGTVFRLSIDKGVVQASIRPDEIVSGDGGRPILLQVWDIDVEQDRVLRQESFELDSDVIVTGPTMITRGAEQSVGLPDGREIRLPDGNFAFNVVHDPATDTLYTALRAATPEGTVILSSDPSAIAIAPVGLQSNERPLMTLDDGRAWLIARSPGTDCSATILLRSLDGIDRTVLESEFPLSSLRFESGDRWVATGSCNGSAVPTQQFGTVQRDSDSRLAALRPTVATHIVMPEWSQTSWSADGSIILRSPSTTDGSLTISVDGALVTQDVGPSNTARIEVGLAAHPLPVFFSLHDGWRVIPVEGERAALRLRHTSGAVISVHDSSDHVAVDGLELVSTSQRVLTHLQLFREALIPARLDFYRDPVDRSRSTTVITFTADNTDVVVAVEAPSDSTATQDAIDEMLGTLRYFERE